MNNDRRTFGYRYDDIEIKNIKIIKHGGYRTSSIVTGISGNKQNKYDSDSNYVGSNGTYLNKSASSYEPVTYEVLMLVLIKWKYRGENYDKYKTFDVTDYVDTNINSLHRLTQATKFYIRKQLLMKKYVVIHNIGEEWELNVENPDSAFLDYVGDAVYKNKK